MQKLPIVINGIKYTHRADFYFVKCYFNPETNDLIGINKFYDFILVPVINVFNLLIHEGYFPLNVYENRE